MKILAVCPNTADMSGGEGPNTADTSGGDPTSNTADMSGVTPDLIAGLIKAGLHSALPSLHTAPRAS